MADDTAGTTDHAGKSKPVPAVPENKPLPKLEEHELLPPHIVVRSIVQPPTPVQSVVQAAPPPTPKPVPQPLPVTPPVSFMPHPTAPSAQTAPIPAPMSAPTSVPIIPLSPPAQSTPAAAAPATPRGPFRDNILNILNAIKLPERFTMRGAADPRQAPTEAPSEPVILSETMRPAEKNAPPAPAQVAQPIMPPRAKDFGATVPPIPPIGVARPATPAAATSAALAGTAVPANPFAVPIKAPPPAVQKISVPPATSSSAPATTLDTIPLENAPSEEPGKSSIVTPIRTLKEDLMHVVRDRKISLVRAVALEEDKKREVKEFTPREIAMRRQRSRHIFVILFTAGVLFLLGVAALFGVYTVQNQYTTPAPNPNNSSIIFAEQTYSFPLQNLSASDIKRVLAQARGTSNATLGSITRIVPTVPTGDGSGARAATTAEFFKALGLQASDDLVRALSDQFFFGIHTIDKNAPILIIPVVSYEHAFAGMLAWEPTMNTDLAPAFTALPLMTTDQNGLPTQRVFKDVVMRNYDARALEDDSGGIELYYSFPVPNILVIAEDPYSFTEILSRLQVQRRL